ncbi:choline/ethanolaminephosphotransferase 1-like [Cucumis melo var. makuwa]|uniref:Choline/ethanolaminephosphotransferase 1-like n=1 Tax=Cucumis melo var. makuwa TaxID=1194695 RepID=A0A5D3CAM9_CUCMM|nr:choline/ethanolaminephosphotransferase 1-like [Cucumis melo var. makuwa]
MGYIGAHGVAALRRYKYSGEDHSFVAKYVLQPFWSRFVNVFPLWMPFSSTKMGSCCPWVTPILVSGCDALACAFESLAFGSTAMCGRNTFWLWVIAAIPFYGATWEHYFTNSLILPTINGPTEGLMLIYLSHFFTAFVGAEWWAQPFGKSLPFLSWVPFLKDVAMSSAVMLLMTAFGVIPTVAFNVFNVYKVVRARKGSMLLALAMLCPFAVLLGGVLMWDYLSPSDLIKNYPHLVVTGSGLAFGFLVGRMILAHLCDEPKGLKTGMCMSLFYLPFAIANALTARLGGGVPVFGEGFVLVGYVIYTGALYLHFATSVIEEMKNSLGIHCFRNDVFSHFRTSAAFK